jgi:hypothetical protein
LSQARASGVTEYASFMRREFPPLVRRELDFLIDGELEERLRDRIVEMVRGLQSELDHQFQQRHSPSQAPSLQTNPYPQLGMADESSLNEHSDIFGLSDSWWLDTSLPDIDEDGLALSFPSFPPDSGYGSMEKHAFKDNKLPDESG